SYKKYQHNGFLFDEGIFPLYFEDNDLKMRTYLAGYKFAKVNTAMFKHEVSHTIRSDANFSASNNDYFNKNLQHYCMKYNLFQPSMEEWREGNKNLSDFVWE
ncbi:MAG TPA: hypothetical protein VF941_05240, partial [Clostridia bacterium]